MSTATPSSSTQHPSLIILMGINDSYHLGPGWHATTVDERYRLSYRPTAEKAEVHWAGGSAVREITLLVASSPPMLGGPVKATARLNGQVIGSKVFGNDLWRTWRLDVKDTGGHPCVSDLHTLELSVETPFVPNDLLQNGDYRPMGLFVSSIRVDFA